MSNKNDDHPVDGEIKRSIKIKMIRHAESRNNQVYRNARYIYRGGTADFDVEGWKSYVNEHRVADPSLSDLGFEQADLLRDYLVPFVQQQVSHLQVITSPMKRTLATIRPTVEALQDHVSVLVHAWYHESEGCHLQNKPQEGMSPAEIQSFFNTTHPVQFEQFPDPQRGWYVDGTAMETRYESEQRATKFYTWLCDYLDSQLYQNNHHDIYDAGVVLQGEELENDHDKHGLKQRKRRTVLLIGHGDFMSLILKRIVMGFGHSIEHHNTPHRSAFVHVNTGITEMEYFGHGRFLILGQNQHPHIREISHLSGGQLKDGWSYLMPGDQILLDQEVAISFADELDPHTKEQSEALRALYLSSETTEGLQADPDLSLEEENHSKSGSSVSEVLKHIVVRRGLQVVGVATYNTETGVISDVAVRPSAGESASATLLKAVKDHSRKLGRSGSLTIVPRSKEHSELFQSMGFKEMDESDSKLEYIE